MTPTQAEANVNAKLRELAEMKPVTVKAKTFSSGIPEEEARGWMLLEETEGLLRARDAEMLRQYAHYNTIAGKDQILP